MENNQFNRQNSFGYLTNYAARLFAKNLYKKLQPYRLNAGEWPLLMALWEEPGMTQTQLAETLKIAQASVVHTLDRLEKKLWIKRVRSLEDRRYFHVFVRKKSDLMQEVMSVAASVNQQATANLTDAENAELKRLMHKLIQNLED